MTYATITLQNYFRLYQKLAGMTGTAATEAEEFWKIYKLDVLVIPTHMRLVRKEYPDLVFKSEEGKFRAVAKAIEELHQQGRPVLVGTVSIEKSERLSEMLKRRGVPHQVLNAKFHEKEAVIVAQAGKPGSVTVATNMAGRGTDIVLGGDPRTTESPEQWQQDHQKVVDLGGLHIIGTERHDARRIDNQLRGRSGRQGDPGSSRFYVSLQDDIMRRFGGDRIRTIMNWAGIDDDTPLESRLITKSVEGAQSKVEAYNFDIRKHLVEYDDVVNTHRDVIYGERRKILGGADLKANIQDMIAREIADMVAADLAGDPENWKADDFLTELNTIYPVPADFTKENILLMSAEEVEEQALAEVERLYQEREELFTPEHMRSLERLVMLRIIDSLWVQHLTAMSNLRQGIGLHAYGQRDPLVMYKKEGHEMFDNLLARIQHDIVHTIFHVAPAGAPPPGQAGTAGRGDGKRQPRQAPMPVAAQPATVMSRAVEGRRTEPVGTRSHKVGRNEPCPCGSGKKYKRCHGAAA